MQLKHKITGVVITVPDGTDTSYLASFEAIKKAAPKAEPKPKTTKTRKKAEEVE